MLRDIEAVLVSSPRRTGLRSRLAWLLLFPLLALAACGDGGGTPVGPVDPGTPPPPPPTPRADSVTVTIGAGGGAVLLPDGSGVVFPEGAVASGIPVTVMKEDPSLWFEPHLGGGQVVLNTRAPTSHFAKEVEVRVPLPSGFGPADSARVLAGLVDHTTGAVEVHSSSVQLIDGKPFLVLRTNHFSHWFAKWWVGDPTPPSGIILPVPYYGQGSTGYCWATTIQMVTQAAHFAYNRSTTNIISAVGVDEDGINIFNFRYGHEITLAVQQRTGVRPERLIWTSGSKLESYLVRQLGMEGRPVALFLAGEAHAVVLVGYTTAGTGARTFFVHDPQGTTPGAIGYRARSAASLREAVGFTARAVTLVVPATIEVRDIPVNLNFVPGAVNLLRGPTPNRFGVRYEYFWEKHHGYAFREAETVPVVPRMPGSVEFVTFPWGVEVANVSRSIEHEVEVVIRLQPMNEVAGGTPSVERAQKSAVGPNRLIYVKPAAIPVDSFRHNLAGAVDYQMIARVRPAGGGALLDEQRIFFTLEPVTAVLTTLTPAVAAPGQTVTLSGEDLGRFPLNNRVVFSATGGGSAGGAEASASAVAEATEIVSWSNTEVRVRVPAGAESGTVSLFRGEVPSNTLPFTLDKRSALSGTVSSTLSMGGGAVAMFDGSWSMSSTGGILESRTSYDRHILTFNPDTPVEFTLDFTADYAPRRWVTPGGETWELREVIMVVDSDVDSPSGASPTLSESGSGGSRSFTFGAVRKGDSLAIMVHYRSFFDRWDRDGNLLLQNWENTAASLSASFIIEAR